MNEEIKEEIKVTQASDNIFEDLGFTPSEAAALKVRADLMLNLRKYILSQGWTQEQAAAFFCETQPCISNLIDGEVDRFSADKLINMLAQAGMQVRVEVLPKVA
jgi:predicted XRE-type DNA-binding protein